MEIEVVPLAITQIDWDTYTRFFNQVIGKSVSHDLDAHFMPVGDLPAFIASLAYGQDPRQALRTNNTILQHASASFATNGSDDSVINIQGAGIKVLRHVEHGFGPVKNFSVLSGSLFEWKIAAIDLCIPSTPFETRFIMNNCCLMLEKAGLNEIFGGYSKTTLADKTFVLRGK